MMLQILVLVLLTGATAGATAKVSQKEVKELADSYFDFRIRENPGYAASYGVPKYQDQVEEWNYAAFDRRIEKSKEFLQKADDMMKKGFDHRSDELDVKLLQFVLNKFIDGSSYMNYSVTLNDDLPGMPNLLSLTPLKTMDELHNWYGRVIGYQSVFEDQADLLDVGIQSGITQTQLTVEGYLKLYKDAIANTEDDFFAFQPWKYLNVSASNSSFYEDGKRECKTLRDKIVKFANKLENEYLPACRDINHISQSSVPGGDKYYEATLKYYTSEDTTPEKAHQIGLKEVERITTAMKDIVKSEGFNGTIRQYVNTLYNNSDEYFSTPELLLQGYKDMLKDKVRPKIGKEFFPEPDIGFDIVDDPYGSLGRYLSPKWDEANNKWTKGKFLFDGSKPHELLKIVMLPLLVHEGVPGHHYQIATVALSNLPEFRKYSAYGHYGQGAFNFPFYGVYIEGWALYSEYTGELMGIFETDKEKLGGMSQECVRAARLVVDTGLHYYNWTYERAVDYLIENTILSPASCETQIKRYIRWPGQACSYKIGELKLKELRKKAQDSLGSDLNIKEFHKAIVDLGAVPLEILEDEMDHWIEQQVPAAPAAPAAPTTVSSSKMLHPQLVFIAAIIIIMTTY